MLCWDGGGSVRAAGHGLKGRGNVLMGDFTHVFMKILTWNIQGLGGSKCVERKKFR